MGLTAAGTGAFGALIEPFRPVAERVTVPIDDLPPAFEGFRIAQISDLHVQPGFPAESLRPAHDLVRAEQPDLIVLTGDYVNDRAPDFARHMEACAGAVADLKAPHGVYAIFGNHDFPPPPADPDSIPWDRAGIKLLKDTLAEITKSGEALYLVGLRSLIARPVNPGDVIRLAPPKAVKIVLWHEPDRAAECARAGASLQLSGHTHGGQVVLPVVGPPILPSGGRRYASGLFQVEGMPLYVSRGVGLLPPMIRLNCPPEVTLITLRRR